MNKQQYCYGQKSSRMANYWNARWKYGQSVKRYRGERGTEHARSGDSMGVRVLDTGVQAFTFQIRRVPCRRAVS